MDSPFVHPAYARFPFSEPPVGIPGLGLCRLADELFGAPATSEKAGYRSDRRSYHRPGARPGALCGGCDSSIGGRCGESEDKEAYKPPEDEMIDVVAPLHL